MNNERLVCLCGGKISSVEGKRSVEHPSSAAENYLRNLKEIRAKNDWKKNGAGAMFMGQMDFGAEEPSLPKVFGLAAMDGKLAYTLHTGDTAGIYLKDLDKPEEKDGYVLTKREMQFFEMDAHNGCIALAVGESTRERHLAVVTTDGTDVAACTEGESRDANPKWSRREANVILYDSCGLGYDRNMQFVQYGPRSVYRVNVKTGALEEILEGNEKAEYMRPFEAADGTIYCIRRPYREKKRNEMTPLDVLFFPVRVLKAIFGWLNFFSQRYGGESLKTGGQNPAKSKPKSEEELFIEGNLLDVEQNMKENRARGEKNPGTIPASWELIAWMPDGTVKPLRRGVLDYCVCTDGFIVSNGKYLLRIDSMGETLLGDVQLGVSPVLLTGMENMSKE